MIRKVEFIKDFVHYKKGDVIDLDASLASRLVNLEGVAKYREEKKSKK